MRDQYRYKIEANAKALDHVKSKIPNYSELFPIDGEWSVSTDIEIDYILEEYMTLRPEMIVGLHFESTEIDESGYILFKDGRKRWVE